MDEGELQLATARNCTSALGHLPFSPESTRTSIHTLPVELLTEIFGSLVPKGDCMDPEIPHLVSLTPVCRRWRQAVLNAPFLWSTLAFINPKSSHIVMVQQWLERSKSLPLTLALEIDPNTAEVCAEWDLVAAAMDSILATLIKHMHRWKSVRIFMRNFPIQPKSSLSQLPLSPEAAPLLEEMNVVEDKCLTLDSAQHFWKAIGAYSSVRRVVWGTTLDDPRSCLPDMVVSPWNRITHLNSEFVVDDAFFNFLSRCTTLEDLDIGLLECPASPSLSSQRVCLPRLRRLALNSPIPTVTTHFLNQIELPLLDDLYVGKWHSGDAWTDLLERSSCQLRAVWVCDSSSSDAGIIKLLLSPAVVHLEELVASLWCHGDVLFRFLTWSAEVRRLPFLRKIDMSIGGFTCGVLSEMLNSRLQHPASTLNDLNFDLGVARTSGDIDVDLCFLNRLRENGFEARYS